MDAGAIYVGGIVTADHTGPAGEAAAATNGLVRAVVARDGVVAPPDVSSTSAETPCCRRSSTRGFPPAM